MDLSPVKFLRNLGRSREIATVLLNHGFGDVVERLHLLRYLRWWRRVVLRRSESEARLTRAQRIRMALEELGPTFVKFGQVVSTRPDLVPAEVIRELSRLQEHVPPFPGSEAVLVVQGELEAPLRLLFAEFDTEPLAAGSLGQVHRARHFDGTPLAVKIRRPGVVRDVERDISLMSELALLVERHLPEAEIIDPVGLVSQFARTIRRELSFIREGKTMDEFRRLFRNDATLIVPRVHWDLTTDAVITMEYIDGFKIRDRASLQAAGLPSPDIAANGARIFMRMAFEFGIFHGDPHPGNLRVMPGGAIGLLDYGMVGRLEEEKCEQLIDLFVAITRGESRRAVDQVLLIGRPFRPVDRPLLTGDLRDFIDGYYGIPLEKIEVGNLLSDFVSILANHGIRYPADLMLLIRAIITLEGVGRDLDPNFNLARHLAPFVEQQVRDRYNPRRVSAKLLHESRILLRMLRTMPGHVNQVLEKLGSGDFRIQLEHRHLDHLITEVDRSGNRIVVGMVMSSLIVSTALIIHTTREASWWITVPAFVLSSLLGVWLVYGIFRSGRL